MEIHELAFELILTAAKENGLLKGKTVAVDATDLEANASMKSIVRKDNGDDWREYLRKLYEEETGISDPDDEDLRRFDKRRKSKKKVSNEDWESKTDPDSRIGKMKDGRFPPEVQGRKCGRLRVGSDRCGRGLSRQRWRYLDD